jgi:riboflavin kinase/FMN adenylyltransferase
MTVPPAIRPDFPAVRDATALPSQLAGAFLAIGNFDGVHRGHRAVIDTAISRAKREHRPALALTFEPHPRSFFRPAEPLFRLTPESAKLRLLAAAGLDGAVVMTFDAALASRSAEAFIGEILVGRLAIAGVVVGADFRFGKGRLGTPEFLQEEGAARGFAVEVVPPLLAGGRPVSSGAVRDALSAGEIAEANDLLGHAWFVEGKVVRGAGRGAGLGFPTANLALDPSCALKHGIYAVRAHVGEQVGERAYQAVASFGRRPQFDDGAAVFEVLLFDFEGDLYGKSLTAELVDFIRPERKFSSVEALQAQMKEDSRDARAILARAGARTGKA